MIFDEVTDPEQLRQGMHNLLEEAQVYGITMTYIRESDGTDYTDYLDWTVRSGFSVEAAIVWVYSEHRHHWLLHYHRMAWHRMQEFIPCTDEETA